MKFAKKARPGNDTSKCASASSGWKKFKSRVAAVGLLLLIEGCAATQVAPSTKCACDSPEELRLAAIEQRLEATKQKISKLKEKVDGLQNLQRELIKTALEGLFLSTKKRTCEHFREELNMTKSLARYDEHHCKNGEGLDPVLNAKIRVHCPHIDYLTRLIKRECE